MLGRLREAFARLRRPKPAPTFEDLLEEFYRGLPLQGAHIVDVGAHTGRHALPLASLAGPRGSVHAFEPLAFARDALEHLARAQGHANIVVHGCALGREPGRAELAFRAECPEESGLQPRACYNDLANPGQLQLEKLPVEVKRLDDALPPDLMPRFLKLDVEGGELDVLRGAQRLLDRSRPIVAFECGQASYLGYHDAPEEIFDMFDARGYKVYSLTGVPVTDRAHFRQLTIDQRFWDYVAFPPGDEKHARRLHPMPPRRRYLS
jgi:FkbM family methyltransferase